MWLPWHTRKFFVSFSSSINMVHKIVLQVINADIFNSVPFPLKKKQNSHHCNFSLYFPDSFQPLYVQYSQHPEGSRHETTWLTPLTPTYISLMNRLSPRKWPDVLITVSDTPNQVLFSSLCLLYCSFPFPLSLPAAYMSWAEYDTLWHGSWTKFHFASIALPAPNNRRSIRDPWEVPLDILSLWMPGALTSLYILKRSA